MQVYKISMFFNGRSTWAMPSPPLFPYCMGRQGSSVSAQTGEKESPHPPHLQIVSDVQNTTYLCQSSSCSLRNEENYSSLTLCCTDHCVLACTCVRTSHSSISRGLYYALKWNTPSPPHTTLAFLFRNECEIKVNLQVPPPPQVGGWGGG